ncbi:MAG TPA: hypothetical protein VK978_04965 [Candidatus Saccharimonadales bacterium]|nr:hypothetical protein [Candidatus Saccharimonadales bacterium]
MVTKTITALSIGFIFAVLSLVGMSVLQPQTATAQGATNRQNTQQNNNPRPNPQTAQPTASYVYVAQPGDAYSKMARKAVQTYGKKFKINLSLPQILFAETNLTQQTGSPYLTEGQQVTVSEATVRQWVDRARQLDAAAVERWAAYVPGVNFNTNDVGER